MEKSSDYQIQNRRKLSFSQLKQIVPHRACEIVSGGRRLLLLSLSTPSRHITERQRQEIVQSIPSCTVENGDRVNVQEEKVTVSFPSS